MVKVTGMRSKNSKNGLLGIRVTVRIGTLSSLLLASGPGLSGGGGGKLWQECCAALLLP